MVSECGGMAFPFEARVPEFLAFRRSLYSQIFHFRVFPRRCFNSQISGWDQSSLGMLSIARLDRLSWVDQFRSSCFPNFARLSRSCKVRLAQNLLQPVYVLV